MIFLRPISNKSYDIEKNLDITKPPYSEQIFASPLALRNIEVPLYTAFFCFSGTGAEESLDRLDL